MQVKTFIIAAVLMVSTAHAVAAEDRSATNCAPAREMTLFEKILEIVDSIVKGV
ncbi:hypothetical protein [Chitinimonas arctica]|uniref:hypothetical protein n=1 Tax=Chitinimonas arctica TaxID=2594795 RepID=UPI0015D4216F|nr:hypothetical protein [Chitinimonas arctica]